ncbi:recombinase family protein [Bacillus cereus]|uniref:recombinase family protein n=1 Tax=Bacillus cereus TaxID=1396 RepID=UPI0024059DE7|nr:recombinase family protein [Bacillus cereus]MDF9626614.1 recombinase family protein [Bacillus cereus]
MRNIGYVRGNEEEENLAEQIYTLQHIKIDILYQEKVSGADNNWPERNKLLQDLRKGDIIWVTSLTHFISSTAELCEVVTYMQEKGAHLQSVKDIWLDLSADNPHRSSVLLVMEGCCSWSESCFVYGNGKALKSQNKRENIQDEKKRIMPNILVCRKRFSCMYMGI